jgi:peptide deformylase
MLNINNYITYIGNPEDIVYLQNRAFPVNMRLFKTSESYREIVLSCCEYMKKLALEEMEEYKKPHGISGANVAIPFNIIAIVRHRGKEDEYVEALINPVVTKASRKMKISKSNCGSIRLSEDIDIARHEWIEIDYFNENGEPQHRKSKNLTVQHEVDHNLGILITQRKLKE